jgi:16S rRNA G966 N2-methylase RsmD
MQILMKYDFSEIFRLLKQIPVEVNSSEFVLKNPNIDKDLRAFIAELVDTRKKAKKKLPTFFNLGCLIPKKNFEQATSEAIAMSKVLYLKSKIGLKNSLDLTGGLGLDSFFLSKYCENVVYVESEELTADIASFNFSLCNPIQNIQIISAKAEDFLMKNRELFSLIYADPDRRVGGNRDYRFEQSSPNPIWVETEGLKHGHYVAIKHSPMTDISLIKTSFSHLVSILTLSHKNEVKEILTLHHKDNAKTKITEDVITINANGEQQQFEFQESSDTICEKTESPLTYFYEPDKAIIKSGFAESLAKRLGLKRLSAKHIPYYTSYQKPLVYSGKIGEVIDFIEYSEKKAKKMLDKHKVTKAAVGARGFVLKPNSLEKKLNILSGDDYYLFFYIDTNQKKVCLLAKRIC